VRGIDDLEAITTTDSFLGVTFYLNEPYSIAAGVARFGAYGFDGTPSVMFDGVIPHVGGQSTGSMFYAYEPSYNSRRAIASPLLLDALYTVIGTTGTVTVDLKVDVDLPVTTTGNQLLVLVCRDGYHGQSNMVMEMSTPVPVTITTPGETQQITVDFTVDPAWPQEEMQIIALVQSTTTDEMVQAGLAAPDYKADVAVVCEPGGMGAGWTMSGPAGFAMSGAGNHTVSMFFAGEYTLTWDTAPYWTSPTPNPESLTVAEDGSITFTGTYSDGPFSQPLAGDEGDAGPGRTVCLVDYDADGASDLHVVNDGAADLLLHNTAGSFADLATGLAADTGAGCAAAWQDVDGDGHLDYYLGRDGGPCAIHLGDGAGGFTPGKLFGLTATDEVTSASWVDFDLDGLLDLYLTNRGTANVLYRYNGVMGEDYLVFGVTTNGAQIGGNSSGAVWCDIDNDGRLDLYVLTEFGDNVMLQNTPLGFSDITPLTNLGDNGNAADAAWGDYDNDGDFDLFLANDRTADRLWEARAWDNYNWVPGENLEDRGTARSVVWGDFDNDTFLDLYVVRKDDADLLLYGHGDGSFTRVPVGPVETLTAGARVVCGDMNNDGALDLYLVRDGAANVLLNNERGRDNNWLAVHLMGNSANPLAIGSQVRISLGDVSLLRQVDGKGQIVADGSTVHFGLGDATFVYSVEVTWPDGTVSDYGGFDPNHVMTIGQSTGVSNIETEQDVPAAINRLDRARPNPFNPATTIGYAVGRKGHVKLDIYSIDGRHVRTLVDSDLPAGEYTATWQGRDGSGRPVASGTYLYRLTTPEGAMLNGRMVMIK